MIRRTLASGERRIAVVGNQAFTLVRFRGPLIRALVAQGHSVFAFMPEATAADCEAVRALGAEPVSFHLDRTGMNPVRDLRTVASLFRAFRRCRIDLVLCYFIKPVIYGLWAARLAGVARRFALIEGAGTALSDEQGAPLKQRLLRGAVIQLYRSALRHAHKIFFLNRDDQALFSDTRMAPLSKSVVVPGIGIDLKEYGAAPVPNGPMTFVMLTRLLGQKGVREYVAAARVATEKHPDARFILLGGLETNPDRIGEEEARSWVADGVIDWPGRVSDVQAWLAGAHVFVLPSYREGLPRSTLEAMATGRAVITTDAVGCRETVRHGENGLIVPVRDVEALAAAMTRMIETPRQQLADMGAASRAMAEERFDVRVVNRLFMREMGLLDA